MGFKKRCSRLLRQRRTDVMYRAAVEEIELKFFKREKTEICLCCFYACSLCAHKNSGKRWGVVRDSVNYALWLLFGNFVFNVLPLLPMLSLRALP